LGTKNKVKNRKEMATEMDAQKRGKKLNKKRRIVGILPVWHISFLTNAIIPSPIRTSAADHKLPGTHKVIIDRMQKRFLSIFFFVQISL
jgi:hypothetical protein